MDFFKKKIDFFLKKSQTNAPIIYYNDNLPLFKERKEKKPYKYITFQLIQKHQLQSYIIAGAQLKNIIENFH
jgi:hypothetical protein